MSKQQLVWKTVKVALGKLKPWVRNPRESTQADADGIGESLDEFGYSEVLLIGPGFELYDGHQRLPVMLQKYGPKHVVECRQSNRALTETERRKLTAFLHAKATGRWNWDALSAWDAKELTDWGFDKGTLKNWKTDVNALDKFLKSEQDEESPDVEPEIDRAEELREKWGVEVGQLWVLGEHRIICGDCTDGAVVGRLMGELLCDLVITDPPYGVNYGEKQEWLQSVGFADRLTKKIEGDSVTKEQTQDLWKSAFGRMNEVMRKGAVVYCFMPQGGDQMMMMMMMMMMGAGIEPRHELIWLKNQQVFGRTDYAYKHEPILYAWKNGAHKFYSDPQTQSSIIEIDRPRESKLHPTMKPVELIERLMKNSSKEEDVIYEPFSGSGTTIIACENLNRKCRAIEISPAYVAVALERWSNLTGKTPKLEGKTQRKSPK